MLIFGTFLAHYLLGVKTLHFKRYKVVLKSSMKELVVNHGQRGAYRNNNVGGTDFSLKPRRQEKKKNSKYIQKV